MTPEELRAELAAAGDPERAQAQQRYMKSSMPFHGLSAPELRALLRPHLADFAPPDRLVWEQTVRAFWDGATHREERYAAIALARHRCARHWQDVDTLGLHRHLVVTGAWWDVVDEVAAHLVGACLLADRERVTPVLRTWATDGDVWVRRTSVICQLSHGASLDRDLLTYAIEHNLDDPSFWLRKAIGWALRQHARIDPVWVGAYVDELGDRLSGLSRREATKHL
ncbi:MAG: DNA alkylation repair protein [Nocardioides sp.]